MSGRTEDVTPSVPGYVLQERLGAGGHGEVFLARHAVIGNDVAIKILHARLCTDQVAVARFITEARAVNVIQHPSIVKVFDLQLLPDGRPFFVMELLRGRSLRSILDERGRLPLSEAVPMLRQIASAVDAAHAAGVAHRDLKPENVFVLDDGSVKLIDFGLAKLTSDTSITETGAALGTPRYMSPEQCRGRGTDRRSDLYSFGALAYHVLVGAPPFDGEALRLALQHLHDMPRPPSSRCPDLTVAVDAVLLELLAKDPTVRPTPLVAAVDRLLAPPSSSRRLRRLAPAIAALGAVGVAVLVAAFAQQTLAAHEVGELAASAQVVTFRADGLPYIPWISETGEDIVVIDRSGAWRIRGTREVASIPFAASDTVNYAARLPDRRWVVTRVTPDEGRTIWLEDIEAGTRTRFASGRFAEPCPRGGQIAVIEHPWVTVVDIERGTRTVVATVDDVRTVRWSPDCKRLIWADAAQRRYVVAPVDGGALQYLALPMLPSVQIASVAFLDDETIVYCATGETGPEIRAHRLMEPGDEQDSVLHAAVTPAESCVLAVAANGRDAVAILFGAQSGIAVQPTTVGSRQRQLTGAAATVAMFRDDTRMLVYDGRGVNPHAELADRRLREIRVTDGASVTVPTCAGSIGMVRRDGRPVHVRLVQAGSVASIELFHDNGCELAARWTLPAAERWSELRCAGLACVIAGYEEGRISLWRLPARSAASIVSSADAPSAVYPPRVAISPNASHAVVLPRDATTAVGTVLVFAMHGGEPRRLHVRGIEDVIWSADPEQVYISGIGIDRHHNPVLRMALDGTRELLSTSDVTWRAVRDLSPDGTLLALETRQLSASTLRLTVSRR